MVASWFRKFLERLFCRNARRWRRRRALPFLPLLVERLESRLTPTTFFTVANTSNSTSMAGSLPWAVSQADSDNGGAPVVINFAAGVSQTFATPQTITLAASSLTLTGLLTLSNVNGESISIMGPTASLTINGAAGISPAISVFAVTSGTAGLQNLTITDGFRGVYNAGTLSVSNCTISGNSGDFGGGVENHGSLSLSNSTLVGNTATYGGGIYDTGRLTMSNCTVAGNSADFGGGLNDSNSAGLSNSTITGNTATTGGGILNASSLLTLQDSIVAANTATSSSPDVNSITTDSGNNFLGTAVNSISVDPTPGPNDVFSNTPMLTSLGNNGGPTQTMALSPNSKAMGAGITISGVTTDQRGLARPAANPDIGAFQTQGALITLSSVVVNGDYDPIMGAALAAGTVTMTSDGNNGFSTGATVVIAGYSGVNAGYNGTYTLLSASGKSFSYADANTGMTTLASNSSGYAVSQNTSSDLQPGAGAGHQRSMVDSIVYTFNQDVNVGSTAVLLGLGNGVSTTGTAVLATAVPNANWTSLNGGSVWVMTFSSAAGNTVSGHSIADGVYTATLNNTQVTAADSSPMTTTQTGDVFYRLYGDFNGGQHDNATDTGQYSLSLNLNYLSATAGYQAYYDYTGTGHINATDTGEYSLRLNSNWTGITPTI